jgi:hypothetical protein
VLRTMALAQSRGSKMVGKTTVKTVVGLGGLLLTSHAFAQSAEE